MKCELRRKGKTRMKQPNRTLNRLKEKKEGKSTKHNLNTKQISPRDLATKKGMNLTLKLTKILNMAIMEVRSLLETINSMVKTLEIILSLIKPLSRLRIPWSNLLLQG